MYNVHWTYDDMSYAIHFLLDNIFVRFWNEVFRQIVGIHMGKNCALPVADFFLYILLRISVYD
jgi:hypothetical protein